VREVGRSDIYQSKDEVKIRRSIWTCLRNYRPLVCTQPTVVVRAWGVLSVVTVRRCCPIRGDRRGG
jgi:hypothetical protein